MEETSELKIMQSIDDALSGVSDPQTRDRILRWAWAKFSPTPSLLLVDEKKKVKKKDKARGGKKKSTRSKVSYTMLKDLNLKPSGEKSFKDFVAEKQPSTDNEKCVLAVYYVANILGEPSVNVNHVFTCFKHQGWRPPANLNKKLVWVASQKGWLDTSDMSNIRITVNGENLVDYDLPTKTSG